MEFRRCNSISSVPATGHLILVRFVTRRKTMITISRMALIAAVTAAGIASPALAQSFDPDAGSGNVLGFSYAPSAVPNDNVAVRQSSHAKIAARKSGLHAFALVPGPSSGSSSNDPALTGGGSAGYNQMLQQY
jgi:hypothetical protein